MFRLSLADAPFIFVAENVEASKGVPRVPAPTVLQTGEDREGAFWPACRLYYWAVAVFVIVAVVAVVVVVVVVVIFAMSQEKPNKTVELLWRWREDSPRRVLPAGVNINILTLSWESIYTPFPHTKVKSVLGLYAVLPQTLSLPYRKQQYHQKF